MCVQPRKCGRVPYQIFISNCGKKILIKLRDNVLEVKGGLALRSYYIHNWGDYHSFAFNFGWMKYCLGVCQYLLYTFLENMQQQTNLIDYHSRDFNINNSLKKAQPLNIINFSIIFGLFCIVLCFLIRCISDRFNSKSQNIQYILYEYIIIVFFIRKIIPLAQSGFDLF